MTTRIEQIESALADTAWRESSWCEFQPWDSCDGRHQWQRTVTISPNGRLVMFTERHYVFKPGNRWGNEPMKPCSRFRISARTENQRNIKAHAKKRGVTL